MNKRVVFLDWLRVLACLMVIIIHACEFYYCYNGYQIANATDLWCVSFIDAFCRVSVPLFFLISGYLLAPLAEGTEFGPFIRKRFKRVMIPYFCFVVIYCTLPLLWGGIDPKTTVRGLSRILLNFPMHAGHLWFPIVIFGLYLFLPVISPWLRTASKKGENLFLLAWFIASCLPYLSHYWGNLLGDCGWNRFNMLYCFNGYLGYFVLGHYLRKHFTWSRKARIWGGLAIYVAGAVFTGLTFFQQVEIGERLPRTIEIGWDFVTPNLIGATFGIFILFSALFEKSDAPSRTNRLMGDISQCSYGMYLMHILYLNLFQRLLGPVLPTPAAIPAMALCAFLCSYVTTKLVRMIPGGKYVVG